jgi:3'(2'), 5'-bisphosphate nucleotidase
VIDESDAQLASRLATAAGRRLLELRDSLDLIDPPEVRDAGDRAAQELLAAELAASRPDDAVLSEEAPDDAARLAADRVWIIDPLDGTREYAEGRHDWAVHVGLWARAGRDGGELVAGAVALPGIGVTLSADDPPADGTTSGGHLLPRIAVSRTRAPALAHKAVAKLGGELVPMGSAGYKVAAVVRGEVDAYLHAGGQYEWDSAAPVAVAQAAGLHTSRLDGSPLRYNRPDPYLPDLLVCRPELADPLLAICRSAATLPPTSVRSAT